MTLVRRQFIKIKNIVKEVQIPRFADKNGVPKVWLLALIQRGKTASDEILSQLRIYKKLFKAGMECIIWADLFIAFNCSSKFYTVVKYIIIFEPRNLPIRRKPEGSTTPPPPHRTLLWLRISKILLFYKIFPFGFFLKIALNFAVIERHFVSVYSSAHYSHILSVCRVRLREIFLVTSIHRTFRFPRLYTPLNIIPL